MIPLGLSAAGLRAFHATLAGSHAIRVRVQTMTLGQDYDTDLTSHLIDGQVNVDNTADVTRSATLTLLDQNRSLSFDSYAPADVALFLDRMLRITYDVWVGDAWQAVPVFTGPITKLGRDGDTINVEAQGKETLALADCWRPLTIRKGTRKTTAIVTILSERAGEDQFHVPDLPSRLPKAISLTRESIPWKVARSLARGMNRHLYYDGAGSCRLRTYPGTVNYTFTGDTITAPLQIDYSGDIYNTVWINGGTPKGAKKPITYAASAPAAHPLSPWKLGRNGVPRHLVLVETDDSIRSRADAKELGDRRLADALRQQVEASFSAVPIPHLDPNDLIRAVTDEATVTFRLTKFTLPLTTSSSMTVGYLRNVSLKPHRRYHR
jgi:hypothetical protein